MHLSRDRSGAVPTSGVDVPAGASSDGHGELRGDGR